MATKQTSRQKKIVGRVMHEFKHGDLPSGSGDKVKTPRQAIAIALNEAGASRRQQGRGGGTSRAELYKQAREAKIPGRSHMNKSALQKALANR